MPTRAAPATEGPILPALMRLAVPIVLANLLQTGYQLTDAFWVGRLGAAAVAAAVSFPITFLMIAIGGGLGVAGATLTAQYFGARDQAMVNHVAAQTMLMVIGVSVVLGALGFVLAPLILHMLGVAPEVYAEALGFLRISFVGLIFVFAFAMFQALMRGVGRAAAPLYIVIATVVLNFALDPLFIFDWGPIPGAGGMGAAMATLSTQALATLVALVLLLRGTYGIAITPRGLVPDFAYIRRAFLLGCPASVELSARALGLIVMSLLVAGFGTVTLAAYGVGSNVLQVVTIPALGLSTAAAALVACPSIGRAVQAGAWRKLGRFQFHPDLLITPDTVQWPVSTVKVTVWSRGKVSRTTRAEDLAIQDLEVIAAWDAMAHMPKRFTADFGAEPAGWHVGGPVWRQRRVKEAYAERFPDIPWHRLPADWVRSTSP